MTTVLAWFAGAAFLAVGLIVALRAGQPLRQSAWIIPAALSVAFAVFSLAAAVTEGPTGFWPEHTRHLWGNQIWFDLLLAAGAAFFLAAPQLRAVGMAPIPWFLAIAATGSLGLMAMLARLMYLQARR